MLALIYYLNFAILYVALTFNLLTEMTAHIDNNLTFDGVGTRNNTFNHNSMGKT